MVIELHFPIDPVPKGRPRFSKKSKRPCTPKATRCFEAHVKKLAKLQYLGDVLTGATAVEIKFYMKRPERPANDYPRGDIDNYTKAILDGLNKIVFKDDAQVCSIKSSKHYAEHGEIVVRVWSL